MIARAKKAIDSLKKSKKGANNNNPKQTNKTAQMYTYESYIIEIGANPYVSSK